jgi:hypothetical protein
MTLKDNTQLRAVLTSLIDEGHPEQPLEQAVLENYKHYGSITKVSKVLGRYYGRFIAPYRISEILREHGVKFKRASSIYDAELGD